MDGLEIEVAPGGDDYVIHARGELDLQGCSSLETALFEADCSRATRILLYLDELTFIDSEGLETLYRAGQRSAANGCRLQMTPGRGSVADMFRITALDMTLPLVAPSDD